MIKMEMHLHQKEIRIQVSHAGKAPAAIPILLLYPLPSVLSLLPGTSARGPLGNQVPLVGGVPAAIPILFSLSCLRCQALQPVDLWETKSPLWDECQQPSPFFSFCPVSLPGTSAREPLGNQVPLVGEVPAAIPIFFLLSCLRRQALQPEGIWETKSLLSWSASNQVLMLIPIKGLLGINAWLSISFLA